MADLADDFDHGSAKKFATQRPFRTLKHVADTLEKYGAGEAAVYVREAKKELKEKIKERDKDFLEKEAEAQIYGEALSRISEEAFPVNGPHYTKHIRALKEIADDALDQTGNDCDHDWQPISEQTSTGSHPGHHPAGGPPEHEQVGSRCIKCGAERREDGSS